MEGVIAQLKQRQVFKVATIYAVSAWPLIQIADLAVPALGLPDSVMTLLLQIFLVGFPITLVFVWLFNFTAKGIVRAEQDSMAQVSDSAQVNVHTTLVVVGTLLTALLVTLASQYLLSDKEAVSQSAATATPVISTAKTATTAPVPRKKESIAVLPFIPFSQDPADEFFADGMVEELLNLLAQVPDLQVAARTSSFAYKNVSNKTIVQIGEELGVDTILEGSIRKNDVTNQIRVTTQLIKVATGEHLWSATFDREYRDVFKIQDDIARAVVDKMRITLLGEGKKQVFSAETTNVDAMVAYGKGQQELAHRTAPSLEKALLYFQQAVAADNHYARAYVGIADANILLALYGNLPEQTAKQNAQQALDKALTINKDLGAAYASLGLLWSKQDVAAAEGHFQRAMKLNPNYAMTYMWYGSLQRERGKLNESHQLFEKAFELDPKSPVAAFNVASGYYQLGNEQKAMELFSHIIGNDPYYPSAYNLVGDILSNRGRLDEAISMYKRALDVDATNRHALSALLNTTMDLGDFNATQYWLSYIEQRNNLFDKLETSLFESRFLAAQHKFEQAVVHLTNIEVPNEISMSYQVSQAEAAYYGGNYSQAVNLFEQIRSQFTDEQSFYVMANGQQVIHLAYAYLQLEQKQRAQELISAYLNFAEQQQLMARNNPVNYFHMALISVLQNKLDDVFYYLQAAIDAGWVRAWQVDAEPMLATFSNNQQFQQMIGGVKARLVNMKNRLNNEETFLLAESETGNDNDGFESFH